MRNSPLPRSHYPRMRDALADDLSKPECVQLMAQVLAATPIESGAECILGDEEYEVVSTYAHAALPNALRTGRIYSLTKDAAYEIVEASKSLESFDLKALEFPSRTGTLFTDALAEGVDAISWQVISGVEHDYLRFAWWQHKADAPQALKGSPFGKRLLALHQGLYMRYDSLFALSDKQAAYSLKPEIQRLYTFFLLLTQPELTNTSTQKQATKVKGKKVYKANANVSVVSLRHYPGAIPSDSRERRTTDKRWVVSGHWRKQWYPKAQVHKPRWIPAHVKGPKGAPLTNPEKVYVLAAGRTAHE